MAHTLCPFPRTPHPNELDPRRPPVMLSVFFFRVVVFGTCTIRQAYDARDALAKAFYGQLFNWLVATINSHINCDRKEVKASVGVLDIFGFECFEHNRSVSQSSQVSQSVSRLAHTVFYTR